MNIEELRRKIDIIDREILERINSRIHIASEIGKVKSAEGAPYYVPEREVAVFKRLCTQNKGPLDERAVCAIYREIISASIANEKQMVIAYLGPAATFTHQAALKCFGSKLAYSPASTISGVFSAVERGEADYGVLPVENSSEGGVHEVLDSLVDSPLSIINQKYLKVGHCLISASPLEDIHTVYSKDQALGQCRVWLEKHLPKARRVESVSTGQAVETVRDLPGTAAIASELAGELYGVPVVAKNIQDCADNCTRFFILGPKPNVSAREGAKYRTSIVFSVKDRPAALVNILKPLSDREINLSKIESRPSRRKPWDYYFFIDFEGHWHAPLVQEAVAELERNCPFVKWLGSYPDLES